MTLGLPKLVAEPGVEYLLSVSFALKRETPWAKRGHEVAWEQWPLTLPPVPPTPPVVSDVPVPSWPLWVADGSPLARLTGREFALIFDKLNGVITSYSYRGVTLLERGPLPDFWRAPTDNDVGAWKSVGQCRAHRSGARHRRVAIGRERLEGHVCGSEARGREHGRDDGAGRPAARRRLVHDDV